jgi:hypothetical protein
MGSFQLDQTWRTAVPPQTRILQIIVLAMASVCLVFLLIATFLRQQNGAQPPEVPQLTYLMLVVASFTLAARVIVPSLMVRAARQRLLSGGPAPGHLPNGPPVSTKDAAAHALCAVYQTRTIIAAALLEGATFLLIIAYLLEGVPAVLAIAAVLIVVIAAHAPSQARLTAWVEQQLRLIDEQRQFGRNE